MSITKRLFELLQEMPEEEKELAQKNQFEDLFYFASHYLNSPELFPAEEELTVEERSVIKSGCRQILDGRGLTPEKPFEGLGITGFHSFFSFLNYTCYRQSIVSNDTNILDRMDMKDREDGHIVTYYNKVVYDDSLQS